MSIGKATLKSDIILLINDLKDDTNQSEAIEKFADVLSDKIADAIQRGIQTATYTAGLTAGNVPVTGSISLTVTK